MVPLAAAVLVLQVLLQLPASTLGALVPPDPADSGFKLHWTNVTIDHFHWQPAASPAAGTFPMRFYVLDEHWDRDGGGPILFYTGNEAPIEEFIANTGWMAEIAPELKAMVVFCEHRYYGSSWTNGSWPFGADSFDGDKVGFLTVEQALADFAETIRHVRSAWRAPEEAAVVAFGGSYGANLAMWMRMKYPWVVSGAIASSLSVQKHLLRRSNAFAQIVTEAYANVSAACPRLIRAGWDQLTRLAASSAGRAELAGGLGLCAAPATAEDALGLVGWLDDGIETMARPYGHTRNHIVSKIVERSTLESTRCKLRKSEVGRGPPFAGSVWIPVPHVLL
jgi:lysosomal Pro-X carboxypeptidase